MRPELSIFWFRRDLRLEDNTALFWALSENKVLLPIFIFDPEILNQLENKSDRRVDFIHQALLRIHLRLIKQGSGLRILHKAPLDAFKQLEKEFSIQSVYCNTDYEPYAKQRDEQIQKFLQSKSIQFKSYKDQCIFERNEVLKDNGSPYTVFTPYSKKWKAKLNPSFLKELNAEMFFSNFYTAKQCDFPELKAIGFLKTDIRLNPNSDVSDELLNNYKQKRDFPELEGTSKLSIYLRFGIVSIRKLVAKAMGISETWLNELIWREFYMMILWHFPHAASQAFKPAYNQLQWRNNEKEFELWCKGLTGFPIVDAGMRELNKTGFMHNRVRMIVSSFLVKDLLIDWRWGEAYFASHLNDFDLSANNGGWQWAAGTGCDAAPYFRIFNPTEQQKKFDPNFNYIKKWIPEFGTEQYPAAIVEHAQARKRALEMYKKTLQEYR